MGCSGSWIWGLGVLGSRLEFASVSVARTKSAVYHRRPARTTSPDGASYHALGGNELGPGLSQRHQGSELGTFIITEQSDAVRGPITAGLLEP